MKSSIKKPVTKTTTPLSYSFTQNLQQTNSLSLHKKSISTNKNQQSSTENNSVGRQNSKISKQSTTDSLSFTTISSTISKSQSYTSDQNEEQIEDTKPKTINDYMGKNQMYILFKFCTFKHLLNLRETCKAWKLLIEYFIEIQLPIIIIERNQLETIIKREMESESSHSRYVRAYKKVSLGHDLIFTLKQNDIEQFYLLKDKSEYIKEIRSITHQIIGKDVIERNKDIKKYSVQYYSEVIPQCKEVQVSEIPKDIILRMKILFQYSSQISDDELNKLSKYAFALKILLSGYLHLYLETNPIQSQKTRLESISLDLQTIRIFNKNKSINSK